MKLNEYNEAREFASTIWGVPEFMVTFEQAKEISKTFSFRLWIIYKRRDELAAEIKKSVLEDLRLIKRAVNWLNWHIGGLRDPGCFFKGAGDEIENHIETVGLDEPSLNA